MSLTPVVYLELDFKNKKLYLINQNTIMCFNKITLKLIIRSIDEFKRIMYNLKLMDK